MWLSEIVNLLTSPGIGEIGSRLHYISQFLDLSPILLVAIGLIASFQGGLRRSALELAALPLLLFILPLLSAFYFFLAPVSVANSITLVQKQQQIGVDQIERIDRQIDRASSILRESESIGNLLSGLQRIPGLQVRVPPQASVTEARQEVRSSLVRERDRLRERIKGNVSTSRAAFLRRAATNSLLALLVGLLLWGLHHAAMEEMAQAIPFLDWVLVQGEVNQQPEALHQLLRFQRACIALGWLALLERSLRFARKVIRRPSAQALAEEEAALAAAAEINQQGRMIGIQSAPASSLLPSFSGWALGNWPLAGQLERQPGNGDDPSGGSADGLNLSSAEDPQLLSEPISRRQQAQLRRQERRAQRDLHRYYSRARRTEDPASDAYSADPDWSLSNPADAPLTPRQLRRLEKDQQSASKAFAAMTKFQEREQLLGFVDDLEAEPAEQQLQLEQQLEQQRQWAEENRPDALPPRWSLGSLWRWFLHHL